VLSDSEKIRGLKASILQLAEGKPRKLHAGAALKFASDLEILRLLSSTSE
jgi:hypothetical protein